MRRLSGLLAVALAAIVVVGQVAEADARGRGGGSRSGDT
jgi:hypothetical protein